MIDLRALRENPEPFRASQRARGADVDLVDRVIAADETRRQALAAFENLRAEQKQVSRSVGKASPEERPAILANAKELAEQVKAAEAADALADLIYVIYGMALETGIDLASVLAEVQRSNMSKLGADGKPVYREDGKVLKGPDYFPPNVEAVLSSRRLR